MFNKILLTGGAGFIGSSLVDRLTKENCQITIVDNFDPFYSKAQKEKNIQRFINNSQVRFLNCGIENLRELERNLGSAEFDIIVHLAAKAGVRPSIADPIGYQNVNVGGTQNLLEIARKKQIRKFVFASSSSVYGVNENTPWCEDDYDLRPISPYASTKLSGELLGHVYMHLYKIQFIALRFFTVYGPRQRPDLAIHKFAKSLLEDTPITMFGNGETSRDYTFIDDIIDGIIGAMRYNQTPFEIINLGNNRTISLKQMIEVLESVFERKAIIKKEPEQPGDVQITYANISKATNLLGYAPAIDFEAGVSKFKEWLLENRSQ